MPTICINCANYRRKTKELSLKYGENLPEHACFSAKTMNYIDGQEKYAIDNAAVKNQGDCADYKEIAKEQK